MGADVIGAAVAGDAGGMLATVGGVLLLALQAPTASVKTAVPVMMGLTRTLRLPSSFRMPIIPLA